MKKIEDEKSTLNLLIENNIALQKVVTNLAADLKKLSSDISELLELFKEATKTISAEKIEEAVKKEDLEELKGKIDELLEQNKVIAKGILLLESSIKPKEYRYPE
ncbi:MAG: hypothetical protein QW041_00020 [Candidatus Pacearchaeota archaeon]